MTTFDDTLADRRAVMALMRELRDIQRAQDESDAWVRALLADAEESDAQRARRRGEIMALLKESGERILPHGSKHLDVPGFGRLQYRTTETTVRIADPKAFMAWAKEHEEVHLIRPPKPGEESLDTNAAKALAAQAIAENGDVLPGVEIVPENTTLAVEWRLV